MACELVFGADGVRARGESLDLALQGLGIDFKFPHYNQADCEPQLPEQLQWAMDDLLESAANSDTLQVGAWRRRRARAPPLFAHFRRLWNNVLCLFGEGYDTRL